MPPIRGFLRDSTSDNCVVPYSPLLSTDLSTVSTVVNTVKELTRIRRDPITRRWGRPHGHFGITSRREVFGCGASMGSPALAGPSASCHFDGRATFRKRRGAPVRFQVNRDVFSEAVSFVVKLLPQRNPQPILAGVLIEADDSGLTLSAFDYEASARTTIEATVDTPGTILVHGRLLSDIASRLPNAPIEIAVEEDGGIAVTCGSARFTLAAMPVEEYPSIPEVTGTSGVVPADDFGTAISQVGFAASRDDVTPVLTGVQLEVSGHNLSLVATDRYRVSLRDVPWDGEAVESTALVPARTLVEVGKTFG